MFDLFAGLITLLKLPFYVLPKEILTDNQVEEYGKLHKFKFMIYEYFGWKNIEHEEFVKNIKIPDLKRYHNVNDFEYGTEVEKNMKHGLAEYAKDPKGQYETFWGYRGNDDLLFKYKRPKKAMFDKVKLSKYLEKQLSHIPTEYIMLHKLSSGDITLDEAFTACKEELDVEIVQGWTFMRMFGYKLFHIYENDYFDEYIGSFYLKVLPKGHQPSTVPLHHDVSLVKSPMTHQLTHELVHAIQYCYTLYYKYPKELVELPAMLLECKYSKPSREMIDRTVALALADLEADDPKTFDFVFTHLLETKPYVNVSNRLWHYTNYARMYYSYVFGLVEQYPGNKVLKKLVIDPEECKKFVDKLLG